MNIHSGKAALIGEHSENVKEAFALLALIAVEFQTDPMSVQCFDLSIVERVHKCVGKRVAFLKHNAFWSDT